MMMSRLIYCDEHFKFELYRKSNRLQGSTLTLGIHMTDDGSGYFLYHSIGQYPGKAADLQAAMAELTQVWGTANDQQWNYLFKQRARFIDLWQNLIGAPAGTLTSCENVTQALHTFMTSLPKKLLQGKRVLVAADCFPSNHFLLAGLSERLGFTLETVPMRQGASYVADEDMLASWDRDVAVALVTWVSSTSSHRVNLSALVKHGKAMGSIVGIDITQAAGLLPFSVVEPRADFVISTSLKWMCGTPGAGVLYVENNLLQECQPELRGWFSQDNPFSWALDQFRLAPDIRRFDNGTPGMMAAAASVPALEWHARQDKTEMIAHNRHLSDRLIVIADEHDLSVISPRSETERGGSIMIKLHDKLLASDVLQELKRHGVFADSRGQVLRFSPGPMTTDQGMERVQQGMRAAMKASTHHGASA
jgi:kynureninase